MTIKCKLLDLIAIIFKVFIILIVINNHIASADQKNTIKKSKDFSKIVDNTDWQRFNCDQNFCSSYFEYHKYKKTNKLCSGCYFEPTYPLDVTTKYPRDTLIINADRTKLISKGLSQFIGNVIITKNDQQITTDHVKVQQNLNGKITAIIAKQQIKIVEPGLRFIGRSAQLYPQKNYKVLYDVNYRIYNRHATGDAKQVEIFNDNMILMKKASYTTCSPVNREWYLVADQVKLNKITGKGEAWHAKMYIKKYPVFYWPYINFPIDKRRQSGFLMPTLSSGSKHGLGIEIPWYWNIAPNYDYTLSLFHFTKRAYKFNNQFRYLTENFLGTIRFNFLPRDKANRDFVKSKLADLSIPSIDPRSVNLKYRDSRSALFINSQIKFSDQWRLYIDFNKVGDDNYLQDFKQDLNKKNSIFNNKFTEQDTKFNSSLHLNQSITLENINKYGTLNFTCLQYQTLHSFYGPVTVEQYKKLPAVTWDNNYIKLSNHFRVKYKFSYTNFQLNKKQNRDVFVAINPVVGKRTHMRYNFNYFLHKPYGNLQPRLQLDLLSYRDLQLISNKNLHNNIIFNKSISQNSSRVIPILDLVTSLNFIKKIDSKWQQTLEPKIYYLYVPKVKQNRYPVFDSTIESFNYYQLFRDNRYNGIDRLSDANQVTFGIKTGMWERNKGEIASLSIAKARFFRKLEPYLGENIVVDKWSPTALLFTYNLTDRLLIETNTVMQNLKTIHSNNLYFNYIKDSDKIINFGYHYERFSELPQQQGWISTVWAVTEHFKCLGAFSYDLNKKRRVDALGGIEFHSCCSVLRLICSHNLPSTENINRGSKNYKILFQLVFKGFTDVGNLGNNYISYKFPGYKPIDHF